MSCSSTPAGLPPAPEPLPVAVADNHCHLDIPGRGGPDAGAPPGTADDAYVRRVLDLAASVGVPRVVQIGCDLPAARWTVSALDRYPEMLGGVALHPNEAPVLHRRGELEIAFAEIETLAAHPRVRVIGESGLDHFRTPPDGRAAQEKSFRRHVDLAKRLGLVLQIHDRDAHSDVLRVLEEEGAPRTTVFHCFSGDAEMARYCAQRGWYLSFAGTVTFANAEPLREALRATPVERVLVETDAPYLTPVPYRGRTNAAHLVPLTVRAMAQARGEPLEELCSAIAANTERVYGSW